MCNSKKLMKNSFFFNFFSQERVASVSARTSSASKTSHTRHKRQNDSSLQVYHGNDQL